MTSVARILLIAVTVAALLGACAGTTTGPILTGPLPTPSPNPVAVTTPEAAIAAVIAHEPRLQGIAPRDPAAIGQASWYEVAPASGVGAFVVNVRIGWGDCEAGCIDEHTWVYAVAPSGDVSVVSQGGAAVPDAAWPGSAPAAGRTGIGGRATSGPVCPVEQNPPDPACAARPVAGAVIMIRNAAGADLFRVTTGADGSFFAELPAGGYVVAAQPANGLMGTPAPVNVTVNPGATSLVELSYDTGIR